jgi:hypothetical protein
MSETVVNLPQAAPARREIQNVVDAVPILDTARFEHMQRIANVLARSSMIPETLRTEGNKDNKVALPFEQILSNCFLVVNQAARWGMDPFAVISCCSVVHGRLAYEGKLVAAVLEAKLGVHLIYEWDDKAGDQAGIKVSGTLPDGRTEFVTGTVGQWKTTGPGSPWIKQPRLQLAYRGSREWGRLYAPGVMLGVYGEDEMDNLVEDARARRAQPVTSLKDRLTSKGANGFSVDHVERETGNQSEATDGGASTQTDLREQESKSQVVDTVTTPVVAAQDDQAGETPAAESNSSDAPQGQTDTPAADAPIDAAGTPSELSEAPPESDNVAAQDVGSGGHDVLQPTDEPSTLAPDWQETYLKAMARVNERPKSLQTRHNEALQLIGGKANASEQEWMKAVYRLTERRLRGEISKDDCDAAIREIS